MDSQTEFAADYAFRGVPKSPSLGYAALRTCEDTSTRRRRLRTRETGKSGLFKIPVGLGIALQEAGISTGDVVTVAALPPDLFRQPNSYVTPDQYYALWSAIREVSRDPNIGILLARSVRPDITEPFFLALINSPDVAGAVEVVARFRRLLDPQELTVSLDTPGQFAMIYEWPRCSVALPQSLVDAEMTLFVEVCRRGTGSASLAPREVQLTTSQLEDGHAHRRFFTCQIVLGARNNALVFDLADLKRPFGTHNPDMLSALIPYLRARMPADNLGISARVESAISARLRGRKPVMPAIARELAMSTRALQRQLKQSGTSFRQLLDGVRREHAFGYLSSTRFTDHEIAFLLGFDDPNSFYRAFRAWSGKSPSQVRALHGNAK